MDLTLPHLAAVSLKRRPEPDENRAFPFSVPVVNALTSLDLSAPVTFFVGENGSGKSTLLEGIAAAAHLPTVGAEDVTRDETLAQQRSLAAVFRLGWAHRTHRGFFLRAEDFFGFTRRLGQMRAGFLGDIERLEEEYRDRSAYAKGLAQGPARTSLAEMEQRYGVDLDANSHGQSFLKLFQARFIPGGLYVLDEPEAPLSPQSQLGLILMLNEMVNENAQFIIATHSPLLLAFPGATIYSFDETPIAAVKYEALDHVTLTRDFLNHPERFLRQLR